MKLQDKHKAIFKKKRKKERNTIWEHKGKEIQIDISLFARSLKRLLGTKCD